MGRLIDADELRWAIRNNAPKSVPIWVYQTIDNVPTAYDHDKVVEQLEKLKKVEQDRSDDCDENGCGDSEQIYDDGRSQGRFEAFGKAIEIVKGGGVDAD